MDFHCYYIEILTAFTIYFNYHFSKISIGIWLKFQLDLQLIPLVFHWNCYWIPNGLPTDFHLYFIKFSTGYPTDFHWGFFEISTGISLKCQLDFQLISIGIGISLKIQLNFKWFSIVITLKFKLHLQFISIIISLKFPLVYHWNFKLFFILMDFHWRFFEIWTGISLTFQMD